MLLVRPELVEIVDFMGNNAPAFGNSRGCSGPCNTWWPWRVHCINAIVMLVHPLYVGSIHERTCVHKKWTHVRGRPVEL